MLNTWTNLARGVSRRTGRWDRDRFVSVALVVAVALVSLLFIAIQAPFG